jgi:hypothetical protein
MGHANGQLWLKAIMTTAVIIGFMLLLSNLATASDGAEFAASATQFETWVKGNLGKLAAFVALAVGAVVAAVKKDWSWFFGAIVLSMGVGIVCGIINASFTAIV